MSKIDTYNAPRGCVAVSPEESSLDGIDECSGCCFDSSDDSVGMFKHHLAILGTVYV